MVQAGQQASKLIEEARAAAAKVQEQETQKAVATAQSIVEKARQAAEAEHARMLTDLRREVGRLVVNTTTKVTGKVLTVDDQKRLAEETNRELAA
jgi:F-type H+-transporting ATPase subunit b